MPERGAELVKYLLETPAAKPVFNGPNPWLDAFDALLSKPENFPLAWKVRFSASSRNMMMIPKWVTNLTVGKIKDEKGVMRLLVVNDQEEMFNPGPPGSFSYYVFDLDGKFLGGGIDTNRLSLFQRFGPDRAGQAAAWTCGPIITAARSGTRSSNWRLAS